MITGSGPAAASQHRGPFQVDEDAALAELEQAWATGGYHGFTAEGDIWCAITSAGQVLADGTPDELARKIRAHWQAMQGPATGTSRWTPSGGTGARRT